MAYLVAAWIALFNLFAFQPVYAALMERPKVEYSTDETMQTEVAPVGWTVFASF